jgi:hypothetical protein
MPIPTAPNGGQSALEKAAIAARNSLIPMNSYNSVAPANQYSATHTRALADEATPVNGKGTGGYLDINNYNAGGSLDINGNPEVAIGSGRNAAIANNAGTWGYSPTKTYMHPDTKGNTGEVIIY